MPVCCYLDTEPLAAKLKYIKQFLCPEHRYNMSHERAETGVCGFEQGCVSIKVVFAQPFSFSLPFCSQKG